MKTGEICYSRDGAVFNDNLEDFEVGDIYYSGEVREILPSELLSSRDVTCLAESMEEALYEQVGEVAEGNFKLTEDKQEELLTLLRSFMNENAEVTCYAVEDVKESIVTVEDIT